MIRYTDSLDGDDAAALTGFFEGWPDPPTPETHLALLRGSAHAWLALDDERVVGFVTATSDGVLTAFLPLLEVLPAYRGQGIGAELVRSMLGTLDGLYAIDVVCDDDVMPFYERLGFTRCGAMVRRDYVRQSGRTVA